MPFETVVIGTIRLPVIQRGRGYVVALVPKKYRNLLYAVQDALPPGTRIAGSRIILPVVGDRIRVEGEFVELESLGYNNERIETVDNMNAFQENLLYAFSHAATQGVYDKLWTERVDLKFLVASMIMAFVDARAPVIGDPELPLSMVKKRLMKKYPDVVSEAMSYFNEINEVFRRVEGRTEQGAINVFTALFVNVYIARDARWMVGFRSPGVVYTILPDEFADVLADMWKRVSEYMSIKHGLESAKDYEYAMKGWDELNRMSGIVKEEKGDETYVT